MNQIWPHVPLESCEPVAFPPWWWKRNDFLSLEAHAHSSRRPGSDWWHSSPSITNNGYQSIQPPGSGRGFLFILVTKERWGGGKQAQLYTANAQVELEIFGEICVKHPNRGASGRIKLWGKSREFCLCWKHTRGFLWEDVAYTKKSG